MTTIAIFALIGLITASFIVAKIIVPLFLFVTEYLIYILICIVVKNHLTRKFAYKLFGFTPNPSHKDDYGKDDIKLPNPIHYFREFRINNNKVCIFPEPSPSVNTLNNGNNTKTDKHFVDMVNKPTPNPLKELCHTDNLPQDKEGNQP